MPDLVNQQPLQTPAAISGQLRGQGEVVEDPGNRRTAGLRDLHLSEEAAAIIKQLLEDPKQPTHAGQELPTADASALLKNNRRCVCRVHLDSLASYGS